MTRPSKPLYRLAFLSLAAAAMLVGCDDGGTANVVPGDTADSSGDAAAADTDGAVSTDSADAAAETDAAGPDDASDTALDVEAVDDVPQTADTDATDAADATDDADATDATDDGGPDTLTVSEEAVSISCAQLCAEIATQCGDLGDLGEDTQACEILCAERLTADVLWAANYSCQRTVCDASVCFATAAPLPEVPGCSAFCAHAAACGEFAATGAPDGEDGLCTAYCGGRSASTLGGPAIVGCTNAAFSAGSCGVDGLRAACRLAAQGCENLCDRFYTMNSPDNCFDGSPLFATWPTVDKCITACSGLPDGTRSQFFGCVAAGGCDDPTPCLASVPTVQPACTSACDAGIALCKGTFGGLATKSFCAGACSGAFKVIGVEAGNADAAACITNTGLCPALDVNNRISVVGLAACAAKISPTCSSACSPFDKCAETPSDRLGCVQNCTALEASEPAILQQVVECVQKAAGNCAALDSCVPQ